MATIATNRAAHIRVNPQMRVGKRSTPFLTQSEQATIRKAIAALQRAVDDTNRPTAMVNLTSAFQLTRAVIQARK